MGRPAEKKRNKKKVLHQPDPVITGMKKRKGILDFLSSHIKFRENDQPAEKEVAFLYCEQSLIDI